MSRLGEDEAGRSDIIEIVGELRANFERSYLFYDGKQEVWLPKSQCQWDKDTNEMSLPEWLAKDRGLI